MLRRESQIIDAEKENVTGKSSKLSLPTRRVLGQKSTNLQLKKSTTTNNLSGIKKPTLRRTNSLLPQIPQPPTSKNVFNRGSGNGPLVKRREVENIESEDDLEVTFDMGQTANWGGLAERMGLILETPEKEQDFEIEVTSKRDLPDLEDVSNHRVLTREVLDGVWNNKEVRMEDPLNLDLKLVEPVLDLNVKIDNDELELEFSDCETEQDKLNSIMEFYK